MTLRAGMWYHLLTHHSAPEIAQLLSWLLLLHLTVLRQEENHLGLPPFLRKASLGGKPASLKLRRSLLQVYFPLHTFAVDGIAAACISKATNMLVCTPLPIKLVCVPTHAQVIRRSYAQMAFQQSLMTPSKCSFIQIIHAYV